MRDTALVGNLAHGNGGAIYSRGCGHSHLQGVTVAGNVSSRGGAITNDVTLCMDHRVDNSIVWNNRWGAASEVSISGLAQVSHSDIEAPSAPMGDGNLNVDPGFIGSPLGEGEVVSAYVTAAYETVVEVAHIQLTPGTLGGLYFQSPEADDLWYPIVDNTASEIVVGAVVIALPHRFAIHDLHLRPGAAPLDAGDDAVSSTTDLEGRPRVDLLAGGVADLGAYERQGPSVETACLDDMDNDGDGDMDCMDSDCPWAPLRGHRTDLRRRHRQ